MIGKEEGREEGSEGRNVGWGRVKQLKVKDKRLDQRIW